MVSTLGWTFGLVLVAPNETFDPLIQFLSTLGAWPVFWMNLVKQSIVLAIFGVAQFPILRRFVRKAHWWILVSALGGALVRRLQQILLDNGSLGAALVRLGNPSGGTAVDGIFGPVTESAVRDLQQRYNVLVTGEMNPLTWEVLDMQANPYRSPPLFI